MDFKDEIKLLGERVSKLKDQILTEEATKNAFIMPFIKAIGYDVFNPLEVVPEFIADIGLKKGEKIDYAIFKDGHAAILIECKHWTQNLDLHEGQLLRYFHVSKAKFGILTNGIQYRFYTDISEPNKMDEKPFLDINILDVRENQLEELKKFHKSYFDVNRILNSASELRYTNELKQLIHQELNNPSPDFVKYFAKQAYVGVVTSKVLDLFTNLTKKSFQQYISDLITERLKTALRKEDEAQAEEGPIIQEEEKIKTTEEEMEGYFIVKSILRQVVDVQRIAYRDAQTYFSILLDDNNRKTICRLYLNGQKKILALMDEQKKESKRELNSLDDLFQFSNELIQTIKSLEGNQ